MSFINVIDIFKDFSIFRYLIMAFLFLGCNLILRKLIMRS